MTFYADNSILAKIPGDLIARGGRHCRRQGLASLSRCLSNSNSHGQSHARLLRPASSVHLSLIAHRLGTAEPTVAALELDGHQVRGYQHTLMPSDPARRTSRRHRHRCSTRCRFFAVQARRGCQRQGRARVDFARAVAALARDDGRCGRPDEKSGIAAEVRV